MPEKYPSLDEEQCEAVLTAQAAHYIKRKPQTLRHWACKDNGPIRPVRINGRLHWRTDDLRRLLNGGD